MTPRSGWTPSGTSTGMMTLAVAAGITACLAACSVSPPPDGPPPVSRPTGAQFPDASTTGVPTGTRLVGSKSVTVERAGTVVDGLDIRGTLAIEADDVVVRRTRVVGAAWFVVRIADGARGVRIEDVEVDGLGLKGLEGSTGIEGPAAIRRVKVRGVENGIRPHSGSVVEQSLVTDLAAPGSDPHIDGIEVNGGSDIVVRGNVVDLRSGDPTSAVMLDNYSGPLRRVVVEGNRLLGGGYTVYVDGRFSGGPVEGVVVRGNRLGRGYWGYTAIQRSRPKWTGNVDDTTGATIAG